MVDMRVEGHEPLGNVRLLPFVHGGEVDLFVHLVEALDQGVPVLEVLAPHDHGELVSARSEDGAVLEHLADQVACRLQIHVALLVAVLVVDQLEVVAIEHAYGEFQRGFFVVHVRLQRIDRIRESPSVLRRGQGVNVHALAQLVDVALHMVRQHFERCREPAYLVVAIVIQVEIVVPGIGLLGGRGQVFEGFRDAPRVERCE